MYLQTMRIRGLGPFDDAELDFCDERGLPRPVTVIHGDGGTGKSTLIGAIECTRPARTVKGALFRTARADAQVATAWRIEDEAPDRPHPLWLRSPGATAHGPGASALGPGDDEERLRRREQALFDKQAQGPRGFLVLEFSEHRSFPRSGLSLSDPARTLLRYELRPTSYSDRARHELTRRCKQVLAYAELASALMGDATLVAEATAASDPNDIEVSAAGSPDPSRPDADDATLDPRRLHRALVETIDGVLSLVKHRYAGLDPMSFEPLFETPDGRLCHFDEIAKQARHLIAFVVLSAHAIWVRSGGRDPRKAPGVILIDEIELSLQPRVAAGVLDALSEALPCAQWIVTTSSPVVAASVPASALLTVRRLPGARTVQLYTNELARTH